MKKITSKKLMNYGAMSAAIIATAAASGQVVYTDIEDETLSINGTDGDGMIQIDLNGDSEIDFSIFLGNAAAGVGFTCRAGGEAAANDDPTTNVDGAFVGITAGGFQYPAILAVDDVINDGSDFTEAGTRGDLNFYGCGYDNSQFCGSVIDGYIGLVFVFEGNTHYGWVQLDSDVPDETNATVTVKGYAFDATPNEPVTVGETTLGLNNQAFNSFDYFISNDVLTLKAAASMDNVTIYNINGQVVVNKALSSVTETVDLSAQATGIYIAKVTIDGAEKSFKIIK